MTNIIDRFRIEGLHGTQTVEIVFETNKLVLVGENGTGKSTIANLLCFFLTGQFERLSDFQFEAASLWIKGQEISFRSEWVSDWEKAPTLKKNTLARLIKRYGPERLLKDPQARRKFSHQFDIPQGVVLRLIEELEENEQLRIPHVALYEVERELKKAFNTRVLFLPTYRRIELDFLQMFPNLGRNRKMELLEQMRYRSASEFGYIELVEFGMRDVQELIKKKMAKLRDGLTTALTNLMGSYLKEVIAGEHHSVKAEEILELRDGEVEAMFKRLDESIVGTAEQERLRETISAIKTRKKIVQKNRVVAHFLTRIVKLHRDRQIAERQVKDYVDVCNGYLNHKALRYDNIESSLGLVHTNEESRGQPLEFSALSSGEKQIVSLFTHICLSDNNCFLVIDEPELSLSVAWQKKFLPDIVGTGRCEGLFAVTHSPFIFENELEPYTRSVEEFFEFSSKEFRS